MVDLTVQELAEHFARLLHVRAGHLADWQQCAEPQCVERREALARLADTAKGEAA